MSFFLSIPALIGAGLYELPSASSGDIPVRRHDRRHHRQLRRRLRVVAWLLKFVAHHSIVWFVGYRVAVGAILIVLLATGALSPT